MQLFASVNINLNANLYHRRLSGGHEKIDRISDSPFSKNSYYTSIVSVIDFDSQCFLKQGAV